MDSGKNGLGKPRDLDHGLAVFTWPPMADYVEKMILGNPHNQYNGEKDQSITHFPINLSTSQYDGTTRCVLNTAHLGVGNPGRNQGHSLREIARWFYIKCC